MSAAVAGAETLTARPSLRLLPSAPTPAGTEDAVAAVVKPSLSAAGLPSGRRKKTDEQPTVLRHPVDKFVEEAVTDGVINEHVT